ncbi:MAG: Sec-independent protein translocase subunit TatA/TatB [Candidatus Dormibacteria bacterium]
MLSPTHIVLLGIVLLLALVVFGPKRLPELGHSVGRAIQEFKHASTSARQEFTSAGTEFRDTIHPLKADAPVAVGSNPANGVVAQDSAPETRV